MKTLVLVVNQRNYNIYNRFSAIDSILCSVLLDLSKEYKVYVNNQIFDPAEAIITAPTRAVIKSSGLKKFIPSIIKRHYRDARDLWNSQKTYQSIITTVKPDVILELMRYGSDIGVRLQKRFNVPLVAYFDAPSVDERTYFSPGYSFFHTLAHARETKTILHANKVIIYAENIKKFWLQQLPHLDGNKFYTFQTLDYSRLNFTITKVFNDRKTIGFVGSFLKWHRVDRLVRAFEQLRREKFDIKLLLVGAGEEFNTILKMVTNSPFCSDIELTGFIDGDLLKKHRDQIDIGVMPGTNWYGMPTKVFEYGAAQIPALIPRTEGTCCMFAEGKEVAMFNSENELDLFLQLKDMLMNWETCKKTGHVLQQRIMSQNSKEKARNFYMSILTCNS